MADDLLGHTAREQVADTGAPVRADDDQTGAARARVIDDLGVRLPRLRTPDRPRERVRSPLPAG